MVTSEAAICNMALARIGQKKFINALTDAGQAAELCNVFYAQTRDVVLCDFAWPFAKKIADLAILNESRENWLYVYTRPIDCLKPRFIQVAGNTEPSQDQKIPFDEELNDAGTARVIVTNVDDAVLVYTRNISVVSLFDTLFVDALAWRLGAELAPGLSGKKDIVVDCMKMYQFTLNSAIGSSMNSRQENALAESPFITGRG